MSNLVFETVTADLEQLMEFKKVSPYIFRTRLERILYKLESVKASSNKSTSEIFLRSEAIKEKLMCISDQSNQTPDGTLNSFLVLEDDLNALYSAIK